MALEAPLRSSTGSLISSFSAHADMSLPAPESPAATAVAIKHMSLPAPSPNSGMNSGDSHGLRPQSFIKANSNHNTHLMSPISDIVGPSPVTSNGTETTEIEDEASNDDGWRGPTANPSPAPQLMMLKTNIPDHMRQSLSEEAVSVIHAPQNFRAWPETPADVVSPPPSEHSTTTSKSPTLSPPPISTNIKPKFSMDAMTPLAQNLQDVILKDNNSSRLRSSSASSLELIPEHHQEEEYEMDIEGDHPQVYSPAMGEESEVQALKTALEECWTLCNTLANLSSIHRERVFNSSGTPDAHEKAWKSCWKLCQRLYLSRDETAESFHVRTNLDLCRDFCQSLFDVRTRKDDTADSVLRVSFELNNHLYSAQDSRNLPEAFRERTLDFYITLCHRLMKQRSELAEETDSLLRACWALAEMLFSLRQSKRDGKAPDEELLGSAVQACWELCDIFREGWTQIRPDRGTPRPSQVTFFPHSGNQMVEARVVDARDARSTTGSRASMHSKRESLRSVPEEAGGGGVGGGVAGVGSVGVSSSGRPPRKHKLPVPETPVTEFEDTPISPESSSPQVPNIMVLGNPVDLGGGGIGAGAPGPGQRWSSGASNLSGFSQNSGKTSSTATTATALEDVNITRIKMLIVKAAMNIGFSRDIAGAAGTDGGATSLQAFVKSLPTGSFGSLPAHATLLQNYKNLVLADSTFRSSASLPSGAKRVSATDVAKSVGWMVHRSSQYGFLRELFRLVFGFPLEEADMRKNVTIAI